MTGSSSRLDINPFESPGYKSFGEDNRVEAMFIFAKVVVLATGRGVSDNSSS